MTRRFSFDNRFLGPILITGILIAAHLSFGILEGYSRTGLAIAVAIAAELVLGRLTYGRFPHLASAYITGISVGILVRSPFLWAYALARWGNRPYVSRPSNSSAAIATAIASPVRE